MRSPNSCLNHPSFWPKKKNADRMLHTSLWQHKPLRNLTHPSWVPQDESPRVKELIRLILNRNLAIHCIASLWTNVFANHGPKLLSLAYKIDSTSFRHNWNASILRQIGRQSTYPVHLPILDIYQYHAGPHLKSIRDDAMLLIKIDDGFFGFYNSPRFLKQ